jgi:polyhydroxyalkanoate synthesis regulator phasin
MLSLVRHWVMMPVMAAGAGAVAMVSGSPPGQPDGIADLLKRTDGGVQIAQATQPPAGAAKPSQPTAPSPPAAIGQPSASDARETDVGTEQAQRLLKAVDALLQDAAKNRSDARKLPSDNEYILRPIWTETREDRERKIREMLDAALGVITDVPMVELQKKIDGLRKNIRDLDDRIVALREKQLVAPKDGMLPGLITDTVDSLGKDIEEAKRKIELNRGEIGKIKGDVREALNKAGVQLSPEQVDLLLDSVLSGDLIRLVAVFNSAKLVDGQLAKLLAASGENIGAARKYFAMHAALFALLVHSQDLLIAKIDKQYLPKLAEIEVDIRKARAKTAELLKLENREDQKRALEGNRESQRLAEDAARGYRRYLLQQREQIAKARQRATHDLRIADNTFETVEASYQLRNLMRDANASFEAIQKLEAPTFDQIFKNEELRREFENLTRKLDGPTS